MSKLITSPAWQKLKEDRENWGYQRLSDVFSVDPGRSKRYVHSVKGLSFDFSRSHITDEILGHLIELVGAQGLLRRRTQMFWGEKINVTEGRAVLHTALRAQTDKPILVDDVDVIPQIRETQKKIEDFVGAVREGRWLGATGLPIRTVVNIGIGGSDLGPRLAVSALRVYAGSGPKVHFVANVDASEMTTVLREVDPATTLFVVVSKTFTTQETLLNAQMARRWLVSALGEEAVAKHFVAVSTNLEKIAEFGIAEANTFPMWDWVGGRYSLWSSVGLSVALAVGWSNFKALLEGAAAMDEHFMTAPVEQNIPVLMAMVGIWYRNFWDTSAVAILPYDERLRDLPRYLQQLQMESNGKSVDLDGKLVAYQTGPIIFGECGTVGQHSFHQWLHQGTDLVSVDLIGVLQDDWAQPEHHKALQANLKAQAEALLKGRVDSKASYKTNPGDKPSNLIWLDKLDPYHLGLLLSLYEHHTFVQGLVWGINSFDQFGVELGKKLVAEMKL